MTLSDLRARAEYPLSTGKMKLTQTVVLELIDRIEAAERRLADATRNAEFYDTVSSQLSAKIAAKEAQHERELAAAKREWNACAMLEKLALEHVRAKNAQLAVLADAFQTAHARLHNVGAPHPPALEAVLTPDLVALAADYRDALAVRERVRGTLAMFAQIDSYKETRVLLRDILGKDTP